MIPPPPPDGPLSTTDAFVQDEYTAEQLLKRYLDNHCANADAEGMSILCECRLCKETRTYLGMPTTAPDGPPR